MEMDPDDPDRTVPVNRNPFPLPPWDTAAAVIRLMDPDDPVTPWPVDTATGPDTDAVFVVDPAITYTPDPVAEFVAPPSTDTSPARPPVEDPVPNTNIPLDPRDEVPELITTPPELPRVAAPVNRDADPDDPDEAAPDPMYTTPVLPTEEVPV